MEEDDWAKDNTVKGDDWAKDNTVKGDDWASTSGTSSWKPSSWANKPAYNPPKIEEVGIN